MANTVILSQRQVLTNDPSIHPFHLIPFMCARFQALPASFKPCILNESLLLEISSNQSLSNELNEWKINSKENKC